MLILYLLLHVEVGHSEEWYKPVKPQSLRNMSASSQQDPDFDTNRTLWIETISADPRIFIIHNLLNRSECSHLVQLALKRGMQVLPPINPCISVYVTSAPIQEAYITPYGSARLVRSSTRTNTQAWLDYAQDRSVIPILLKCIRYYHS
jgi:hypothetical protein